MQKSIWKTFSVLYRRDELFTFTEYRKVTDSWTVQWFYLSNLHSTQSHCSNQSLTLSSFQRSLYLFHRVRYLLREPKVFCTLLDTPVTSSITVGLAEMSVKKLNTTGSSSPSACCGGVSIHVPCIQRTKSLLLEQIIRVILEPQSEWVAHLPHRLKHLEANFQ